MAGAGIPIGAGVVGAEVENVAAVGVVDLDAGEGAEIDTAGMDGISVADFCMGVANGGVGRALFMPIPFSVALLPFPTFSGAVDGNAPKADTGRAGLLL
jgi:hypothetical protein